jgi:crossover junction endodeoxyribonuclease RusA
VITFTVIGHPEPQGSTRAFNVRGKRYPVVTSDNPNLKGWRQLVAYAAQHAAGVKGPIYGGVHVTLDFALQRPKSLPKRTSQHLKKPDIDKLARAVLDALTGILYHDDSEVVRLDVTKRYAAPIEAPSVRITVMSCAQVLPVRPGLLRCSDELLDATAAAADSVDGSAG